MMLPPQVYTCRLTLVAEILGSQPASEDLFTQFVQSKADPAVLVQSVDGVKTGDLERMLIKNAVSKALRNGNGAEDEVPAETLRGRTVFLRDELGRPVLRDYVIRGFLKESWRAMKKITGSLSSATKQGIAEIDRYIFPEGVGDHRDKRYIVMHLNGQQESNLERPLRAQTAQGPRVALASSEMLPIGSYMDMRITVIAPNLIKKELLEEWFSYGRWMGLGQWRNGSYGRFEYKLRELSSK